jgi:hypothetical protein
MRAEPTVGRRTTHILLTISDLTDAACLGRKNDGAGEDFARK